MGKANRDAIRTLVAEKREHIKKTRYANPGVVGGWQAETSLLQTLAILELAETIEKAGKA